MSWLRKQFNPKLHTLFIPTNIEKYRGNVPIVMRSKYEAKFANWCDKNPNILWWSSENVAIPYYHPIKHRQAHYYPDFIIHVNNKTCVIELKPERECFTPKYSKRKSLLLEQVKFIVNSRKWQAAIEYCKKRGYEFMIIKNESILK